MTADPFLSNQRVFPDPPPPAAFIGQEPATGDPVFDPIRAAQAAQPPHPVPPVQQHGPFIVVTTPPDPEQSPTPRPHRPEPPVPPTVNPQG